MNSFQMSLTVLNILSKFYEHSVNNWLKQSQQSTLWISNTAEMPIREITLDETKTEVILKVYLSQVLFKNVDVKIGQETILIEGEWQADEGYFDFSRFQSLIPFPYSIKPQTTQAEIEPGILTMKFQKSAKIKQSRVEIKPKQQNSVISNQSNIEAKCSAPFSEFQQPLIGDFYQLNYSSIGKILFKLLPENSLPENSLGQISYSDFESNICEYKNGFTD